MSFMSSTLSEFSHELASSAPTPGGGGACAFVGAMGVNLAEMVGNLTVGKKKYADVEAEVQLLIKDAEEVSSLCIELIDNDAQSFGQLMSAYQLPKTDETRAVKIEEGLLGASLPPLEMMKTAARAIEIHEKLAPIGSRMAISDIGVGVLFCKAALQGALLNVYANTTLMKNRTRAVEIEEEALELFSSYSKRADEVYEYVAHQMIG